jgi:general secretion pathway protein G
MKQTKLILAIALTGILTACKPATQVPSLDRIYTVDEFDRDFDLRQRVLAACASNPGQLKSDPNCVNSSASHLGVGREEDRQYEAKRIATARDIGVIMSTLMLYRLDNGAYPSQEQGLQALTEKPSVAPVPGNWHAGGYLERLPNDPFGHPYQYANPGVHGEIDVYSLGADGRSGGDGANADIGSWQPWVQTYVTAASSGSKANSDSQ